MKGRNQGPGSRPRHAPHPAIWAAAAVILLALAACGSTTTPTSPPPTTTSYGASGQRATLAGAGSTFVAPFFAAAFVRYHQQHPAVSVSYAVVGSGAGIAAFSARQVNFGASGVPMTSSEQSAARGGPVTTGA